MKRKKIDSQRERRLLIAMVVSKTFLAQAAKAIDLELITADHFRVIAEWCIKYFEEYGKAPGKHVEDLYHKWSEDNSNEDLVSAVKDFLETLGDQYSTEGDLNIPYLLDDLRDFITKRKIQELRDSIDYALVTGTIADAEKTLVSYRKVEVGQGAGLDPMTDKEAWKRAFSDPSLPIVTFPGDAGRFFNPAMTRDALIGIQAPEKTGKTFLCTDIVLRGLSQRRRVAMFEVGDLSESQLLKRLGVRWSGRPLWKRQCKKVIKIPKDIEVDEAEDAGYAIKFTRKRFRVPISYASTQRGIRRFRRAFGLAPGVSYCRTSIHPTGTISVQGISGILDQWEQEDGFVADVIVIDYADILAPENPKLDPRAQVNDTWKALRRLSQERHALVIAPTQANREAYDLGGDRVQGKRNAGEDKRKLAHVTGMLALNQTEEEKEVQGMRLNWIVLRESPFNSRLPLYVGTCFALGRALCCSKFPEQYSSRDRDSE